jgi:ABC-type dipeptide/oligopeptide/nickel transport system ATPase component
LRIPQMKAGKISATSQVSVSVKPYEIVAVKVAYSGSGK